jgi:extradiol dioxygenase family protein
MKNQIIFHLAIPVTNIPEAKQFYCNGLGSQVGRENEQAMILNFYGHQVVCHVTKEQLTEQKGIYPRHFGLIFTDENDWETMFNRCQNNNLKFYQQAKLRFQGELTEHQTFFLQDPFNNFLEFKFYRHYEAIFGGRELTAIGDR